MGETFRGEMEGMGRAFLKQKATSSMATFHCQNLGRDSVLVSVMHLGGQWKETRKYYQ